MRSNEEIKKVYGVFNDSFPPILDGVTLAVENYAHWLKSMGKETCVVTPWNPEGEEKPYKVMRYFSLPIPSRRPYRYGYPKLDPFIWGRLRATNFRILHAHCPFSSGRLAVYAKKYHRVPLVGTFHSKYRTDLEHSLHRYPWLIKKIMNNVIDFFNACDEVWIPQADVESTVREYGFKGPLTVVENGNDFKSKVTGSLGEYKKGCKERLSIGEDEIGLLFVGQHIMEKGVGVILEALRLLKGRVNFRMNFIGTGYAQEEMKRQISSYGLSDRVSLNGIIRDRDRLSDYYGGSDLFLFPSFYDNAPLVVREAAAMGTPSVLLRGSTAAEVIREGKNGFLIENSAERMSELIEYLWGHREELREIGRGARESLVRSWQDVVEEVSDRYDILIKRYSR